MSTKPHHLGALPQLDRDGVAAPGLGRPATAGAVVSSSSSRKTRRSRRKKLSSSSSSSSSSASAAGHVGESKTGKGSSQHRKTRSRPRSVERKKSKALNELRCFPRDEVTFALVRGEEARADLRGRHRVE